MEQFNVAIYARFTVDVDQKDIDQMKEGIDFFAKMIDAKIVKQCWEIVENGYTSSKFDALFDTCNKNRWGILTYDLKTLHQHRSGALSIIREGSEMGIPIFFVDAGSAFNSILCI
jgi:hypothetical protein